MDVTDRGDGMLILGAGEVDALVTPGLAREAARLAADEVASGRVSAGRVDVSGERAWMRMLGGMVSSLDLLGFKEFHRVGRDVRYHIFVFRESTGEPIGIVDGRRITSLRTAATAALAVEHAFSGELPARLAVIGSGEEAREGLRAAVATSRIIGANVYSPTKENRDAFARAMSEELQIPVSASESVERALTGAQGAYVATGASDPLLSREMTRGLRLIAAVGATRAQHRELFGDVIASASQVVVDCEAAVLEPGDARDAANNFGFDPARAQLLGEWLRSPAASTQVLFKSVGSVEQDLTLAASLLEAARIKQVGVTVSPIGSLRQRR